MSLRKTIIPLLICLLLPGGSALAAALSWYANPESTIAGYRVHYRTAFESAPRSIDVGTKTSFTFRNLLPETKYFITLTAYNIYGMESPPSAETSFFTPPDTPGFAIDGNSVTLQIFGRAGEFVEVQQSGDLKNWSTARTVLNVGGDVAVSLPRDHSAPRQFYRLAYRGGTLTSWLVQQGIPDPDAPYKGGPMTNHFAYSSGADLAGGVAQVQPRLGKVRVPDADGTNTYTTFSYTFREGARDIIPRVEMSHDLKFWFRAEPSLVPVSSVLNGNGTRTVTLRESKPVSENDHHCRFYRLRFNGPDLAPLSYPDWLTLMETNQADGDHDGDGMSNAFTFATGADLMAHPRNAMPSIASEFFTPQGASSSDHYTTFSYHLRDHITGVTPQVEYSDDLVTWAPAEMVTVPHADQANLDGTRTITLRETEPRGSHPHRFYRVHYRFSAP